MSQHSQRTQNGPSMTSVLAGVVLTLGAVGVGMWVISGSGLDGRHVTGYLGWMALAVLLGGQAIVRLVEWQSIRERSREQERAREQEAVRAAQEAVDRMARVTGTWTGEGPGEVLTVRLDDDGNLVVQGWLSDHWQQHEERIWSHPIDKLADLVQELENSGELKPADDEGTIFMRTLLDLGAWPLPSFDELEHELAPGCNPRAFRPGGPIWDGTGTRDWTRRDGDTQVVSQTA